MLCFMCRDEKSEGSGRNFMRLDEIFAPLQDRRPISCTNRFQPSAQPSATQRALRNPEEIAG